MQRRGPCLASPNHESSNLESDLRLMDAYWRAANYLSVGQLYLYDKPLLKRPLALTHMLLGQAIGFAHTLVEMFEVEILITQSRDPRATIGEANTDG